MITEEIRKHAATIIIDHARDVEFLSISEYLGDHDIDDPDDEACKAIDEAIREATVTVTWPGDPVSALRALVAEARTEPLSTSEQAIVDALEAAADDWGSGSVVTEALGRFAVAMAEEDA